MCGGRPEHDDAAAEGHVHGDAPADGHDGHREVRVLYIYLFIIYYYYYYYYYYISHYYHQIYNCAPTSPWVSVKIGLPLSLKLLLLTLHRCSLYSYEVRVMGALSQMVVVVVVVGVFVIKRCAHVVFIIIIIIIINLLVFF